MQADPIDTPKIAYSIKEACRASSLGTDHPLLSHRCGPLVGAPHRRTHRHSGGQPARSHRGEA
jgi:hypothetical protein